MLKRRMRQAAVGQPSMDEAMKKAASTGIRAIPMHPRTAYSNISLRLLKLSRSADLLIYKIIICLQIIFKLFDVLRIKALGSLKKSAVMTGMRSARAGAEHYPLYAGRHSAAFRAGVLAL